MRRSIALLVCLAASAAHAQNPSTARMGVTPWTSPETLQVEDKDHNWVTIGSFPPGGPFTTSSVSQVSAGGFGAQGLTTSWAGSIAAGSTTLTTTAVSDLAIGSDVLIPGAGATFAQNAPTYTVQPTTFTVIAATSFINGSVSSVPLASPCPAGFIPNQPILNTSNGNIIGTAASCAGSTLTLTANAVSQSTGNNDNLRLPIADTGSTTYTYAVASVDAFGGVGVPVQQSTTTGAATLSATHYIALSGTIAPPLPSAYVVWKKVGTGNWFYLRSGTTSPFIDTGLQSHDQLTSSPTPYRPWWVPKAPPTTAQNDWLVTTVTGGAGTNTLTLAAAASNDASGVQIRHDDTRALNACVNSSPSPPVNGAGVQCNLTRGTYPISDSLAIKYWNSGFASPGRAQVTIYPSGVRDDVTLPNGTGYNFLRNIYLADTGNKAAGWCINATGSLQLALEHVTCDQPYSGVRLFNVHNFVINDMIVPDFFGQQGIGLDIEGDASEVACCGDITNFYTRSFGPIVTLSPGAADFGTGQTGIKINGGVATIICRNCASSAISGIGLWIGSTYSGPSIAWPEFLLFSDYSSEFTTGRGIELTRGWITKFVNSGVHAGGSFNFVSCQASNSFHASPNAARWVWQGGYFTGATGAGAYIEGQEGRLTGMQINANSNQNSGGATGQCPGLTFGSISHDNVINSSVFGAFDTPTWQSYPITLESPVYNTTAVGNTFTGNVNQTVLNQSASITNNIGLNSPDQKGALSYDHAHQTLGIGDAASFANNGNAGGLIIRDQNDTGTTRITVTNNSTGATASGSLALTTSIPDAYTIFSMGNYSGNPKLNFATGLGVTAGIIIDASAGGAAAPLTLKGGSTAGVSITSPVSATALPTSAGTGGLYVCVDSSGNLYKKATCP